MEPISIAIENLPPFGRSMRKEFLIHPENPSLNHGAYGTYPKYVQTCLHKFQARSELNADLWFHRQLRGQLDNVLEQLAPLVKASKDDLVFIPNATSGINAILRSLTFHFQNGDQILHFSTIYPSIQSLIQYLSDSSQGTKHHVTPLVFNVIYPMSNDDLVANLVTFLDQHHHPPNKNIRIALLDHISSSPGIVVPIDRIIPLLRQRNILVLIDGAHAIGQLPIDLTRLSPDIYVTNLHKWLYAVRGCALMFVDKKHQKIIHPTNIALGYTTEPTQSRFQDEFFWNGTMDYSSYMTVPAALEFRRALGGEEKIQYFTHNLALTGGKYLAKRFGTRILQQEEEQIGSMVDVELPLENPNDIEITEDFWKDTLLFRFKVYASTCKHGGKWYGRFSAQIYNDLQDFEIAAQTFITICQELNKKSK